MLTAGAGRGERPGQGMNATEGGVAILTRDEILRRIRAGEINVEPFSEEQVGPASIDLHLDNRFRIFRRVREVFHVTDDVRFEEVTDVITVPEGDYFVLMPGEAALGITRERITLPENVCGWLQGRSRFARVGLMVHITAAFVQPGIDNRQVLEMNNAGPIPLAIWPGTAICQFVFEETIGRARYAGRFRDQIGL